MPYPDHQRHVVPIATQYQYASDTERIQFTRHSQIGQANLVERIKINGPIPSNAASTPRRKSPLSACYTPNDDISNSNDETDISTEHDDFSNSSTVDYVNKNHMKAPLDITSTSTSHLQYCAYHGNNTRGRKHVAVGKSPGISSSSPDENNKHNNNNNTSDHNTVVTHALFDNTARYSGDNQNQVTNTPSRINEQRQTGSNRLSWIQYIDKKQPSWIRGFFDKHRRVNDEMAASNKSSLLSAKSGSATAKTFTARLLSPPLPLQLTSYLSGKLSIPTIKVTNNSSNRPPHRHRYAKNKRKSRKTTDQPPRPATPNNIDDATINGEQRRRPPLLESDVYRMSHRKLTNPRRSLREQVVIINSMFRYLSTLPMKHHQHQQQQWRLLHHITSPSNQTITNAATSSSLKTSSISQSILPHLKHTLTTSSTTT